MNLVELELDETLADFEVQDWIDNVFSVQYPDVKARIKKGCNGLCHKKDEWHYVKDGLPKDSGAKLCYTRTAKYVCASYDEKYDCWEFVFNNLEHCIPSSVIIAWKEIVLLKEIK